MAKKKVAHRKKSSSRSSSKDLFKMHPNLSWLLLLLAVAFLLNLYITNPSY